MRCVNCQANLGDGTCPICAGARGGGQPSGDTLEAELAEVGREVAVRRRTYPQLVAAGKLSQEQADTQLGAMEAVLARLRRVKSGK